LTDFEALQGLVSNHLEVKLGEVSYVLRFAAGIVGLQVLENYRLPDASEEDWRSWGLTKRFRMVRSKLTPTVVLVSRQTSELPREAVVQLAPGNTTLLWSVASEKLVDLIEEVSEVWSTQGWDEVQWTVVGTAVGAMGGPTLQPLGLEALRLATFGEILIDFLRLQYLARDYDNLLESRFQQRNHSYLEFSSSSLTLAMSCSANAPSALRWLIDSVRFLQDQNIAIQMNPYGTPFTVDDYLEYTLNTRSASWLVAEDPKVQTFLEWLSLSYASGVQRRADTLFAQWMYPNGPRELHPGVPIAQRNAIRAQKTQYFETLATLSGDPRREQATRDDIDALAQEVALAESAFFDESHLAEYR